jgi:hypothetical protein
MLPASTVSPRSLPVQVRLDWLQAAAALPGGKTLHLALLLQKLCAARVAPIINLTRRMMALGPISRDACYDGLRRLEDARLISVRRLPGRSPQIVLLEPGSLPGAAKALQFAHCADDRLMKTTPTGGMRSIDRPKVSGSALAA